MMANNPYKSANSCSFMIIIIIFISALFFRHEISILALTDAGHDDALFFRGMEHLLTGTWLGPYDQLTLSKGPMLSIIATMATIIGIPWKMLEFLIYLLACLLYSMLILRVTRSKILMLMLFMALAWNPVFWSGQALRFMREPLYLSFSMMVVSLLAWALWISPDSRHRLLIALGSGMMFGLFWLTREESIWLYPALSILIVCSLLKSGSEQNYLLTMRNNGKNLMVVLAGASIGVSAILIPVILLNHHYYGKYITNELRGSEFRLAVGALMRINAPSGSFYVSISKQSLRFAYDVSPAAAELRPALEGSVGAMWSRHGSNLPGVSGGEIAGGWFIWALRDAASLAGYHTNAAAAAKFYHRLGEEINQACEEGRLSCKARRDTLAPYFPLDRLGEFLYSMLRGTWMIITLKSGTIEPVWSRDPDRLLAAWEDRLGRVAPPRPTANKSEQWIISGWLAHPRTTPALALRMADLQTSSLRLDMRQAHDVDRYFTTQDRSNMITRRFSLTTDCISNNCVLLALAGDEVIKIDISSLKTGLLPLREGYILFVDNIDKMGHEISSARPLLEAWKLRVMASYANLASILSPGLWLLAVLGLLVHFLDRRDNKLNILVALMLASLAAVLMRAALVAYIDLTSWRAMNSLYLSPAYGFSIVFSVTGTYVFFTAFRRICRKLSRKNISNQ